MTWNWQRDGWPEFSYDADRLVDFERRFLICSGTLSGALKHVDENLRQNLTIDLLSTEALKSSEIEGEFLNRDSVQSSIRRNFGLQTDHDEIPDAESGIAEMMVDLYRSWQTPLDHDTLFRWHERLMKGRHDLQIGCYRTHKEPMQIVSGHRNTLRVHFEAPHSFLVHSEMNGFLRWFQESAPDAKYPLPALTRAGLAHLYFVSVHPFEDGNGRVGRAVAEKALSQCLDGPTLVALSLTIENNKRYYYHALEQNNKELEVTDWLVYFAQTVLAAQQYSQSFIDFLIEKTKLYDMVRGQLNPRQEKALEFMFAEGLEGLEDGVTAEIYIRETGASRATATRDLQDLVEKGALLRMGERKHTRYYLRFFGTRVSH